MGVVVAAAAVAAVVAAVAAVAAATKTIVGFGRCSKITAVGSQSNAVLVLVLRVVGGGGGVAVVVRKTRKITVSGTYP